MRAFSQNNVGELAVKIPHRKPSSHSQTSPNDSGKKERIISRIPALSSTIKIFIFSVAIVFIVLQ